MKSNEYARIDESHSAIIENRERARISGITEVLTFDEQEVCMVTTKGMLTVCGDELHVESLSLDSGEIVIEGIVDSLIYSEEPKGKKGFFGKFF